MAFITTRTVSCFFSCLPSCVAGADSDGNLQHSTSLDRQRRNAEDQTVCVKRVRPLSESSSSFQFCVSEILTQLRRFELLRCNDAAVRLRCGFHPSSHSYLRGRTAEYCPPKAMHILPRPHLLTYLQNHALSIEQHEQTHESASTLTDSYWKLFDVHRQLHLFWNPTLCEEHNRYMGHHSTRPPWRWPDLQQQTDSDRCTDPDQQHTSIGTDRRRTTLAGHQSCPSTFPQTRRPRTKLSADALAVDLSFCDDSASPPNLSSASATSDNSG